MNIHALLPLSRCNGPGSRAVVWVQGCVFKCPGCFNPAARLMRPRLRLSPAEVLARVTADQEALEGITLSGGEPFCQAGLLARLCTLARLQGLSIMAYSGYTLGQLQSLEDEGVRRLLDCLDILVDGPYRREVPAVHPWAGSGNQQVHLLSARYRHLAQADASSQEREIVITPEGEILMTGF